MTQKFKQAYANSEERIRVPDPNGPRSTEYTTRLIEILKLYTQPGLADHAHGKYTDLAYDLWDGTGYGPAGDSNSVWGCQERLCEQPERPVYDKDQLIENIRSVGWIIQDDDPYDGPHEHLDGLFVFVPSLDRYLPFNHNPVYNLYPTTVKVFDYQGKYQRYTPYRYGIGAARPVLDAIANEFPLQADRREYGHLYPDAELRDITRILRDNEYSFAVHQASLNWPPEYEWFPEPSNVCEVVSIDAHPHGNRHKYHKFDPETGLAKCGSLDKSDELKFLSEQSMREGMKNFERCKHPACKQ